MAVPLLGTKLFLPRPRAQLVPRARLAEQVDRGLGARLLLVSAPAGFGKTTMVVDRLRAATQPPRSAAVAWLSLDPGDEDPATFWTYVVSALRTAVPNLGSDALALLADPHPPPLEVVLTTVLNELGHGEGDVVLVLDDYHVVGSLEVHTQLAFLLDHAPDRLHLVLVTRADPPLPLARLRASGDLVEIRAADLRFSEDETAAYLTGPMGLSLSPADVATLEARTEGWIAALQLAALSMTGREDPGAFIADFAGDDRYLVDYLVEEVLARQPSDTHDFLLRSSVLDRLSGPLCDAVVGTSGARATLEGLDRANLFLVPLDDRRQWYRYHHLFADVLRARLLELEPDVVPSLHQRASTWFEANRDRAQAIRHARLAGDVERVADLIELEMPALRRDRKDRTLRQWLEELPPDVVRSRPALANGLGGSMLITGAVAGVEAWLDAAEAWLDPSPDRVVKEGAVVVDRSELPRLPAWIMLHRSGHALAHGDLPGSTALAHKTIDLAPADDHIARGGASAIIGLAAWAVGDLEVAHDRYAACLPHFEAAGHVADVMGCSLGLADIQVAQGRPRSALRTVEAAIALATRQDGVVRGIADMHIARAALQVELGDPETARRGLNLARELGDHAGLPQSPYRCRVAMAHVLEAGGDVDAALAKLDEAIALYNGDFSPNARPVPARRARVALRHQRLSEVEPWLATTDLTLADEPSYLREHELVTLAQATAATDPARLDEALALLARLREAAADRPGSLLDICVAQALLLDAAGDRTAALSALEMALRIAEPEGHVRVFVDEGPAMARLLEAVPSGSPFTTYARSLRGAAPGRAPGTVPAQRLVDPLSARELDILRLLASELTGPQMARHLVVSLNTVRTHTKNVYLKLGVNSRMAAVRRARELDLL
ncbi:LuxR C-terminal-related transcriptional regulator [Nocardioides marmoribigeumensis]|uniref:LuxR family maltose regulon positive regulatory protein n=1 Tax=Nocardioides marmoribigeumensis TaxID=433649 RepID=A0ABU2BY69_9ACTN|nr:LuxR C-terminal-related transcriptional regulator [Nocardioides marmoribigeumensis]MDR7363343.1 LuxR family maltose regulon positive regulatory protein [Nocardioides marmoribigeumensis]